MLVAFCGSHFFFFSFAKLDLTVNRHASHSSANVPSRVPRGVFSPHLVGLFYYLAINWLFACRHMAIASPGRGGAQYTPFVSFRQHPQIGKKRITCDPQKMCSHACGVKSGAKRGFYESLARLLSGNCGNHKRHWSGDSGALKMAGTANTLVAQRNDNQGQAFSPVDNHQ